MRRIRSRAARGLRLGEGFRPGVIGRAGTAEVLPEAREVSVQVDAVRVLARPRRETVRVERRDEPEVGLRMHALERSHDRDPGGLVAVNGTYDEDARSRTRDVHDGDRPVLHGMADDNRGR